MGLVRDLQDLHTLGFVGRHDVDRAVAASQGAGDEELAEVVSSCQTRTGRQLAWLITHFRQAAPPALLMASP